MAGKRNSGVPDGKPIKRFTSQADWAAWLNRHHATSGGLWLKIAKQASGAASVSYAEALDVALCYGWIDGQKQPCDDSWWLQKFTPRGPRSIWSKINRGKVKVLTKAGRMKRPGLREVERAKRDGRWAGAYDSFSKAAVPEDLQAVLDRNTRAKDFFATLSAGNRYAILFRVQTAKRAETRARRIREFVAMLEKHEKIHP